MVGAVPSRDGGEQLVPIPVNIDTVNALFPEAHVGSAREMAAWLAAETGGGGGGEPANAEEMAVGLGFGRIVASDTEAPNLSVNLV